MKSIKFDNVSSLLAGNCGVKQESFTMKRVNGMRLRARVSYYTPQVVVAKLVVGDRADLEASEYILPASRRGVRETKDLDIHLPKSNSTSESFNVYLLVNNIVASQRVTGKMIVDISWT